MKRILCAALAISVIAAVFVGGYYCGFHDGLAWRQWDRVNGQPPEMWLHPASDPDRSGWSWQESMYDEEVSG